MTEWAEHSSELARKALDTLHRRAVDHDEGRLSAAALYLVADVICDLTQGIIPNEDFDTIYAVRTEMRAVIETKRKAS